MKYIRRTILSETDKILMASLARECAAENLHVTDLPYRLSSWALDDPENAGLWFDADGKLAGWAVLQAPFWTIDMVCLPAAEPELFAEMLGWTDQRARAVVNTPYERSAWFVMAFSGQTGRIRCLEQAGFKCQADVGQFSWSKVLMQLPGKMPVNLIRPPAGFLVRPLDGQKEVPDYVEMHQSVFESKNMTVEWRRRTLRHPAYRPELDLVVETPDGRLAAFCVCWLDEETLIGQVEPLGCQGQFARRGLGRAALSEGLRRLQALGAQNILVETDSYRNSAYRLYESFGFQVIQDVLVYRKDYDEVQV